MALRKKVQDDGLTFPYRDCSESTYGLADGTPGKCCVLKRLYAHIVVGLSSVRALRRPLPLRCRGVSSRVALARRAEGYGLVKTH
jgi:hypothetical protein